MKCYLGAAFFYCRLLHSYCILLRCPTPTDCTHSTQRTAIYCLCYLIVLLLLRGAMITLKESQYCACGNVLMPQRYARGVEKTGSMRCYCQPHEFIEFETTKTLVTYLSMSC